MSDSQERTEQASPKRLKDVRGKGELSTSKDLIAWLTIAAVALTLPSTVGLGADATGETFIELRSVIAAPSPEKAIEALGEALASVGPILTPLFAIALVAVIASAGLQGGIYFRRFTAHTQQFQLLPGLKKLFGLQAVWEGVKTLLKTAVVGGVLYATIQGLVPLLMNAGGLSLSAVMEAADSGIGDLIRAAVGAGLALAAIDVLVVQQRNRKKTRMTKREVKDENKNTDGDPLVKSQRRSRQFAMSRNRMISAVAGADVLLINPTHIAVALKYEPGTSAPLVVAKGSGVLAARIRREAEDKRVPMVKDIPLARALNSACAVGQEIPEELYAAVARILALVMSLSIRGAARGARRAYPEPPLRVNEEIAP